MASASSIHPAVDRGIEPAAPGFQGVLQVQRSESGGRHRRAVGAQPCLRVHEVLEAGRCAVLAGRRRVRTTSCAARARGEVEGRGSERGDQARRVQGLRCAYVRPHRPSNTRCTGGTSSILAFARNRLVAARVRGSRLVDHRVGSRDDGRGARAAQATRPPAVRLPVAAADGPDRDACREGEGRAGAEPAGGSRSPAVRAHRGRARTDTQPADARVASCCGVDRRAGIDSRRVATPARALLRLAE